MVAGLFVIADLRVWRRRARPAARRSLEVHRDQAPCPWRANCSVWGSPGNCAASADVGRALPCAPRVPSSARRSSRQSRASEDASTRVRNIRHGRRPGRADPRAARPAARASRTAANGVDRQETGSAVAAWRSSTSRRHGPSQTSRRHPRHLQRRYRQPCSSACRAHPQRTASGRARRRGVAHSARAWPRRWSSGSTACSRSRCGTRVASGWSPAGWGKAALLCLDAPAFFFASEPKALLERASTGAELAGARRLQLGSCRPGLVHERGRRAPRRAARSRGQASGRSLLTVEPFASAPPIETEPPGVTYGPADRGSSRRSRATCRSACCQEAFDGGRRSPARSAT
jgi:hypothetical protein